MVITSSRLIAFTIVILIGIFSKLLKRKADDENVHIDGDILFLATIVKEGVISASMLRYKEKHFLMRVACHEEYLSLH